MVLKILAENVNSVGSKLMASNTFFEKKKITKKVIFF